MIEFERAARAKSAQVKELHTLIHQIAESKNIAIKFLHYAGTGHVDTPEQWKIERPIPLTPGELYELTFYRNIAQMSILSDQDSLKRTGFILKTASASNTAFKG